MTVPEPVGAENVVCRVDLRLRNGLQVRDDRQS
jgi:hypothetical protein